MPILKGRDPAWPWQEQEPPTPTQGLVRGLKWPQLHLLGSVVTQDYLDLQVLQAHLASISFI